jgi:hypothetical protein
MLLREYRLALMRHTDNVTQGGRPRSLPRPPAPADGRPRTRPGRSRVTTSPTCRYPNERKTRFGPGQGVG